MKVNQIPQANKHKTKTYRAHLPNWYCEMNSQEVIAKELYQRIIDLKE